MSDIHQIIYASKVADKSFTSEQLQNILDIAKSNNSERGLTGLLVCNFKYFFQVLEGNKVALDEIIAKISGDPRHTDMTILSNRTITERDFYKWSMAFVSMEDEDPKIALANWTELTSDLTLGFVERLKCKLHTE